MTTTVKLALDDLVRKIAEELGIEGEFERAELDGDFLIARFTRTTAGADVSEVAVRVVDESGRRNRTKRKGWEVVARIRNRKGQTVAVYKPFVEAMLEAGTEDEREERIRKILRSNGNAPTDATVRYYLSNTLQYLEQQGAAQP